MAKARSLTRPQPSAVSRSINTASPGSYREILALEIVHNLQYQHNWVDLEIHNLSEEIISTASLSKTARTSEKYKSDDIIVVSGLPPSHTYLHPDFSTHLLGHNIPDSNIPVQREFVIPLSLGETISLKRLCETFDRLPERNVLVGHDGWEWKDAKRVLTAMRANPGMGGDGTVTYYVMQEGAVKPRQNG